MIVRLTGLLLAGACISFPPFWDRGLAQKASREVTPYPRSRTEPWFEKYHKEARDAIRRSTGADLQMWMTDDAFEQVVTHYKAFGVERIEFSKSLAAMLSEKSGRPVKATYVIFDGADGPVQSKHYVSIQRPVVVQYDPLEVHDVTAIALYRLDK